LPSSSKTVFHHQYIDDGKVNPTVTYTEYRTLPRAM
jgi:hypothetical protein